MDPGQNCTQCLDGSTSKDCSSINECQYPEIFCPIGATQCMKHAGRFECICSPGLKVNLENLMQMSENYIDTTLDSVLTYKQGCPWTRTGLLCENGTELSDAPIGYSLSLIVGGLFFAGPMRSRNYVTMLDPFQQRYGAKLGAIMYLPALVGEIFWSACVVASLGSTLAVIVELNFQTSVMLSTLVAVLYTFLGGQYSVCYTDVAQLMMIVFGLVICTPYVWRNEFFQPKNFANLTREAFGNMSYNDAAPNSTNRIDWLGHVTVQEWPRYFDEYALIILGGIPWQDYFQRVLAARSVRNAQLLSIIGGFFCLLLAIPPIIMGDSSVSKKSLDLPQTSGLRYMFATMYGLPQNESPDSTACQKVLPKSNEMNSKEPTILRRTVPYGTALSCYTSLHAPCGAVRHR
uniref:Uncharacterized protein n=1 Tax=Romanomermis culicivorax TaxID=13658 RepID=A0A915HTL2_ROMCU